MKNIAKYITNGLILAGLSAAMIGCSQAEVENPSIEPRKLEIKVVIRPEFKEGDRMPDFSDKEYTEKTFGAEFMRKGFPGKWRNQESTKEGWASRHVAKIFPVERDNGSLFYITDFKVQYMSANIICGDKQYEFGFADTVKIYLDTDLNGYIDKIKPLAGDIGDDAPDCPKK